MNKFSLRRLTPFFILGVIFLLIALVNRLPDLKVDVVGEESKPSHIEDKEIPIEPVPDTLIVTFNPDISEDEINTYLKSIGVEIDSSIPSLNSYVLKVDEDFVVEEIPSEMVQAVEPDYYLSMLEEAGAPTLNDPLLSDQWVFSKYNIIQNWELIPETERELTIAVVDSGVCFEHEDLVGRVLAGYDFVENDALPQDENGHGCAIAGVIAANSNNGIGVSGLSPDAKILPIKVLDSSGIGTYSNLASAIIYAADNGADIINLSLGGVHSSPLLQSAIEYAVERDIKIYAAAGNAGNTTTLYPAGYEGVISVGSLNENLERSTFSNYGADVDIYVAGENILTTNIDGTYKSFSGTSFATPVAIALYGTDMIDFTSGTTPPSTDPGDISAQIIGGHQADGPWPQVVSIYVDNEYHCTGSLVDSRWVLTAAHCVTGTFEGVAGPIPHAIVKVYINESMSSPSNVGNMRAFNVENIYARKWVIADEDDDELDPDDIALIELTESTSVVPVNLTSSGSSIQADIYQIFGWGKTPQGLPVNLMQGDVVNITSDGSMLKTSGGTNGCFKDSGGPLFAKDGNNIIQLGVIIGGSSAEDCSVGFYSNYADIRRHIDWIHEHVNARCSTHDIDDNSNNDVVLYKDTDCSGTGFNGTIARFTLSGNWDDAVKSIKVKSGRSVRIYSNPMQTGSSVCINRSMWDLSQDQYSDGTQIVENGSSTISSFQVFYDPNCASDFACYLSVGALGCFENPSIPVTLQDKSILISDNIIQDGTKLSPSTPFTKVWSVKNTGTTTWHTGYKLKYLSGSRMVAPLTISIPHTVSPGQTVDLAVNMVAPQDNGTYIGYWSLQNGSGQLFGVQIFVSIVVEQNAPPVGAGSLKLYAAANYNQELGGYSKGSTNAPTANSYSMKIPDGWSVITYSQDGYSGEERCWYESEANLQDHSWHNKIESMQVYDYNHCTNGQKVKLYSNSNFQNLIYELEPTSSGTNRPNKDTYSMDIPDGWSVRTWDQDNKNGRSRCWNTDIHNLQDHENWQLSIDSMEIYTRNECGSDQSFVQLCKETGAHSGANCTEIEYDIPSLGNWGYGNDVAKSIYMQGPWEAMLFEHDNYQGLRYRYRDSTNDIAGHPPINNNQGYGTSSVKVRKYGEGVVVFYREGDFNDGDPFKTDNTLDDLEHWDFNDQAKSVKVHGNYEAIFCTEAGFKGNCGRLKGSDPQDAGRDLNSIAEGLRSGVSSVRICENTCDPVPESAEVLLPLELSSFTPGSEVQFTWAGQGSQFKAEISGGNLSNPVTFGWSDVTTFSRSDLQPSTQPYQIRVKSWNPYGESSWSPYVTFYFQDIAPTVLYLTGESSATLGSELYYIASVNPTDSTNLSYLWSPEPISGQGTSVAQYTPSVADTLVISVTVSNSAISLTESTTLNINCPEGYFKEDYYRNIDLTGIAQSRCVESIDRDWGVTSPEVFESLDFGTGIDGDLNVTQGGVVELSQSRYASIISDVAQGSSTVTVSLGSTAGFNIGDEVFIHQSQGGTVTGQYVSKKIVSINGDQITLDTPVEYGFQSSMSINNKAQLIKVLHFQNVHVGGNTQLVAQKWDGFTGGLMAFRVNGELNVESGSSINMNGRGYRAPMLMHSGGNEQQYQGEGQNGAGIRYNSANGVGGGGGRNESGPNGYNTRAAGGGGHATPGTNSTSNFGTGGGVYGTNSYATQLTFGGAGGLSGDHWQIPMGAKQDPLALNGGGVVFITSRNLNVNGQVTSNGNSGAPWDQCNFCFGGGGAGGTVTLITSTQNDLTGKVFANGALGFTGRNDDTPGNGGLGRVNLVSCTTINSDQGATILREIVECGEDNFSVRFTGEISLERGLHTFKLLSDDGARLWVDGSLLVDSWVDGNVDQEVDVFLEAGEYDVILEYLELTGEANVALTYSTEPYYEPEIISGSAISAYVYEEKSHQVLLQGAPIGESVTYEVLDSEIDGASFFGNALTFEPTPSDFGMKSINIQVTIGDRPPLTQQIIVTVAYNPNQFVDEINEQFVTLENWRTSGDSHEVTLDSEQLKSTSSQNLNQTLKVSSKWVNVVPGKKYHLALTTKGLNSDSPRAMVQLYDANFNLLSTPRIITTKNLTANMREFRTNLTVPLKVNGVAVKYAKVVIEHGDQLDGATMPASTWTDNIYFSQNARPYGVIGAVTGIIKTGDQISLIGTGSKDPDGNTTLYYEWSLLSNVGGEIVDPSVNLTQLLTDDIKTDQKVTLQLVVSDGIVSSIPVTRTYTIRGLIDQLDDNFIDSELWQNKAPLNYDMSIDQGSLKLTSLLAIRSSNIISPFINVENSEYTLKYRAKGINTRSMGMIVYGYDAQLKQIGSKTCTATSMKGTKDWSDITCDVTMFADNPLIKYAKVRINYSNNDLTSTAWFDYIKLEKVNTTPENWWDEDYSSRHILEIENLSGQTLPGGSTLLIKLDQNTTPTASQIFEASTSVADGEDVRIIFNNTTELDRFVTKFGPTEVEIWFSSVEEIPSGSNVTDKYSIYYGNPNAINPPADLNKVFNPKVDLNTVGVWRFQEGGGNFVADLSGNNINGTFVNPLWSNGLFGNAGQFGSNNYVQIPHSDLLNVNSGFTMEGWINLNENTQGGHILSKWTGYGGRSFFADVTGSRELRFYIDTPTGGNYVLSAPQALNTSTWYHFAMTHDGINTMKIYLNGVEVASRSDVFPIRNSTSPLRIGQADDWSGSPSFGGKIQNISISKIVKTDFEYGKVLHQQNAVFGEIEQNL